MRPTTLIGDTIEVYTDGACSPNPGRGGWGAIIRERDVERELSGSEPGTTNNRMEMMAAIVALESLDAGSRIVLYTDSQYVRDGITSWLVGWKRRNWRTAENKPVKNADLWSRLDAATRLHEVRWVWVRGHNGHLGNERADQLAVQARLAAIGRAFSGNPRHEQLGWVIERHINNRLHFWNAGALGHGRKDGFTDLIDDAVRFAREEDASIVLFHVCDGQGRVAEHSWISADGRS